MFKNGASVLRADFHLHTIKDKEFKYHNNPNEFVKEYVQKLKEADISIGAITNHNKFDKDEFKALRRQAKKENIFLLPGVELSVKEGANGIHTLIIFSDSWYENGENNIEVFLNQVFAGVANRENENVSCNYDINGVISNLEQHNKDYFIIFAHVDQKSGLLYECGGGLIQRLWDNPLLKERVLGVQKSKNIDKFNNLTQWIGYELPKLEGCDPKKIEDIGEGDKCYLKIGDYSFNAVKYALMDFSNRVFYDIPLFKHGYIDSIEYTGGKLDNINVDFSKELNTIIGIRGSGKSSILETLRYGLDLKADIDDDYKESLVKYVLDSGGIIKIKLVDNNNRKYLLTKYLEDDKVYISDVDENQLNISLESIINNPLYFGQKDLSMRAPGYEFNLLSKLIGKKTKEVNEKLKGNSEELKQKIEEIIKIQQYPNRIDELTTRVNDLNMKLAIYEEKGIAEKLDKQKQFEDESLYFEQISGFINDLSDDLESSLESEKIRLLKDKAKYTSKYNGEIFERVNESIENIIKLYGGLSNINQNILAELEKIKSEQNNFVECKDSLKEEFARIKREIDVETLNPDSFLDYSKKVKDTSDELQQYQLKMQEKSALENSLKNLLKDRKELVHERFRLYKKEIEKINDSQEQLSIEIELKGNKQEFMDKLKEVGQGTGIRSNKYKDISEQFSDFIAIIDDIMLNESKKIKTIISGNDYDKFIEKIKGNLKDCIEYEVPDKVDILYHGKNLEYHSLGQRASAIVLFILTQKDNDIIIIDQPEDDLDNKVIYDELIKTLKERKSDIQFIFVTHNANIPVLGDSEKIIVTEFEDDKIMVDSGSIDCSHIQKKIIKIMEGGEDAFEKRNSIYLNWNM
ncbi:TrlF family AAA-like ATPase [Sporanaerobacter acetigenes]|uniref:PHP domain n=1 Tax=Sporanaerobacter acetigenes DSM 13106 TaxID=1123281 RepID=A0A1M5YFX3_9FIRM|nr:AAA family ATPase [Sporanaerobacter acetigenes]SHI10947.1 PHP domain [Sporanaerobacter acetigenes DSM 13106]